ncbi:MAG: alpha/beta fold hydrolase, partial [Synechococcales cyanobacterium RU_4_20]|nr:alpha/beta fold hydrolase [Synechococcales cyanobacterium RU_4_20]
MTLVSSLHPLERDPLTSVPPARTGDGASADTWLWQRYQTQYKIHYVQAGVSTPGQAPLLLIHGFGASTAHWKKNIAELQQDFEVWAIDLLGFGRSEKAIAPYSGRFWSEQIHAFVQDVIGQPVVLVGNSIGGYATLCAAAYFPESVRAVALLNCAGPFRKTSATGSFAAQSAAVAPRQNPLQQTLSYLRQDLTQQSWVHLLVFLSMRRAPQFAKPCGGSTPIQRRSPNHWSKKFVLRLGTRVPSVRSRRCFVSPGDSIDVLLARMQSKPLSTVAALGTQDPWGYSEGRRQLFLQHYPNQ